jgi:hypothetical protein
MMEGWFKTRSDGSTVFYPWGNLNKQGYVISSQDDFRRLRMQINIWIAVSMVLFFPSVQWDLLVGCGVLGVCVAFYVVWMQRTVRVLEPYTAAAAPSAK